MFSKNSLLPRITPTLLTSLMCIKTSIFSVYSYFKGIFTFANVIHTYTTKKVIIVLLYITIIPRTIFFNIQIWDHLQTLKIQRSLWYHWQFKIILDRIENPQGTPEKAIIYVLIRLLILTLLYSYSCSVGLTEQVKVFNPVESDCRAAWAETIMFFSDYSSTLSWVRYKRIEEFRYCRLFVEPAIICNITMVTKCMNTCDK